MHANKGSTNTSANTERGSRKGTVTSLQESNDGPPNCNAIYACSQILGSNSLYDLDIWLAVHHSITSLLLPTWYTNFLLIHTNYIKLNFSTCFERNPLIIRRSTMQIVHMQPLVSSLSASDRLVQPLRKECSRNFRAKKILSTPSFGGEVKPSVTCRSFTAWKRSLNVTCKSEFRQNVPDSSRPQFHLPPLGAPAWWHAWRRLVANVETSRPDRTISLKRMQGVVGNKHKKHTVSLFLENKRDKLQLQICNTTH